MPQFIMNTCALQLTVDLQIYKTSNNRQNMGKMALNYLKTFWVVHIMWRIVCNHNHFHIIVLFCTKTKRKNCSCHYLLIIMSLFCWFHQLERSYQIKLIYISSSHDKSYPVKPDFQANLQQKAEEILVCICPLI